MTRPRTDHNDLARFLERSLSEEEHARALTRLSASDEDADVLADAAVMLRELEAEDGVVVAEEDDPDDADPDPPAMPADSADADPAVGGGATVIPLRPPSTQRRRRIPTRWLALAAVLAGVVLVLPQAMSRGGGPGTPAQFAAALEDRGAGVPVGWIERDRWPRYRGPGDVAEDDAGAARLGALLVDLRLAVDAHQEAQTIPITDEIAATLPDVTGSESVAAIYRQIGERAGDAPAELEELMEDGHEFVVLLVDPDHFAAGAWTEAAQLAAVKRDAAFFRSTETRRALRDMAGLAMPADARTALGVARAAGEGEAPPDWSALEDALATLGRELWR